MKNIFFPLLASTCLFLSVSAQPEDPDFPLPEEVVESATPVELEVQQKPVGALPGPGKVVEDAIPVRVPNAENTGVLKMEPDESRNWIDSTRDWLYGKSHGTVEWLDTSLLDDGEEKVPTPPSRFRVGLFSEVELKENGDIKLAPVADFDTDVELPNLERRLKVFISTQDPTALPGEGPLESDNALRVGASRGFFDNWKTSVGIKTKWPPEPFAYLQWSPEYVLGERWTAVPQIRPFWESEDGFGGLTSVIFNRWNRRAIFRQAFSLKWTQKLYDEDKDNAANEEGNQFGDDGGGYRWESTTIWGYVPELLDERDYGRRVGGRDVARGYAIKGTVSGNEIESLEARVSLFAKAPAYKDFLFFSMGPEIIWKDDNDWNEEYLFKIGFEMLLWGDDPIK